MTVCNLIICPGTHNQNARHLAALLAGGDVRSVFLCDTLARHNLGTYGAAKTAGDDWLKRHAALLGPRPVTRWDDLLADPTFAARLALAEQVYATAPPARAAVDAVCAANVQARLRRGSRRSESDLMAASLAYMLEEIAGLAIIRARSPLPELNPGEYFSDPLLFDRHVTGPLRLVLPAVILFRPAAISSLAA